MNRLRRVLWRFREGSAAEDGMTLIEIMIAIFILAVGILALAATAVTSLTTMRIAKERQLATAAVTAAIEEIRSYDYRDIAIDDNETTELSNDSDVTSGDCPQPSGDHDANALCFDHDDDGSDPEEILITADGAITDYQTVEADGRLTVRRFVTWLNRDPNTSSKQDAKRVTVVATFEDADGSTRSVRKSTVVAQADRGLPVPKFTLSPSSVVETRKSGAPTCFSHLLRNLGADDSYDWMLYKASANGDGTYTLDENDQGSPVGNGVSVKKAGWTAEAWFEDPVYSGTDPDVTQTNIWRDVTGDGRPDSPEGVSTGEFRSVTFCYHRNADSEGPDRVYGVVVRSAFDSTVNAVVFHEIVPEDSLATYYLHDDPPNDGDPAQDSNGNLTNEECQSRDRTLGTVYDADDTVPSQLCADGSTEDFLYDYDQNLDPSGRPGTYLKRGDQSYQLTWQVKELGDLSLDTVGLTFYSAWDGAFTGSSTTPELTYEIRIEKLSDGGATVTPIVTETFTYIHDQQGWLPVNRSYDLDPNVSVNFSSGDQLQLRIWCTSQNQACHVGHDTNTYRSRLELGLVTS